MPEAVLNDSSFDVWAELRDPIAEAFAHKLDAAVLAGVEKPASSPEAIIPAAIAAGNINAIDSTPAQGGIYNDLIELIDDVEDDGYEVTGIVAKRSLRQGLRKARGTDGQKLADMSTGMIEGVPIVYALPGTMTATEHAIAGQWDLALIGVRQRRERHISSSRRTRAERRAEHLRAAQGAHGCRCPRPAGDVAEARCLWCGRQVTERSTPPGGRAGRDRGGRHRA